LPKEPPPIRSIAPKTIPQIDGAQDPQQQKPDTETSSELILKCWSENEVGDARMFNHLHKDRFAYDHAAGSWTKYAGSFWEEDFRNEAMGAPLDAVVDQYLTEATRQHWLTVKAQKSGNTEAANHHEDLRKQLLKRSAELRTKARRQNVLALAAAGTGLAGHEWDIREMVLPCKNGVVPLSGEMAGRLETGKPSDYIRTACPTEWRGIDEPCPSFEQFLRDIFDGDEELIGYMQRLLGYGITGKALLHLLIILWGKGRNGKGTLLETLKHVLGDLAHKAEAELLLEQKAARASGSANSALMALRFKRLIWASETDEGRKFATAKVKELVGGDTIHARSPYAKRAVEFRPTHLLMLLTNSRPQASADDYALWQRIHLVPFKLSFVPNPQQPHERQDDPTLQDRLRAEAPGILAWLVRGCLEWQRIGLNPPEAVKAATSEYRAEEDTLGHFIDECCFVDPLAQVAAKRLYDAYRSWVESNGGRAEGLKRFSPRIRDRFDAYVGTTGREKNITFYLGIGLMDTIRDG
jgi:putative DNA primase/helicase